MFTNKVGDIHPTPKSNLAKQFRRIEHTAINMGILLGNRIEVTQPESRWTTVSNIPKDPDYDWSDYERELEW